MFDVFKEKEGTCNRKFKVKREGYFKGKIDHSLRKAIPIKA